MSFFRKNSFYSQLKDLWYLLGYFCRLAYKLRFWLEREQRYGNFSQIGYVDSAKLLLRMSTSCLLVVLVPAEVCCFRVLF
jgi:hypothetical protein